MPTLERTEGSYLVAQSREAVRQSRDLCALLQPLLVACRASVVKALDSCERSWNLCGTGGGPPFPYRFYLLAEVEENRCLAIWRTNSLVVHPDLAERARLLIGMGETFQVPERGRLVPAGLDDPVQAALTLTRAADRILSFDFAFEDLSVTYQTGDVEVA